MRAIPTRLAAAGLGMLLAGCGVVPGGTEEYEHPPAPVVESHNCLAPGFSYSGLYEVPSPATHGSSAGGPAAPASPSAPASPTGKPPAAPDAGSVPAGFEAQSVVRCSMNYEGIVDAYGRWSAVQEDHLTGDLEPLLAALDQPSERGGTMACPAIMEIRPELWLLDSSGSAMRPAWPTNACGRSKSGVAEALAELDSTRSVTHRIKLLEPRAALDAGCVNQWSAPLPQQQALSFIPHAADGPAQGSGSAAGWTMESGSEGTRHVESESDVAEAPEQGGSDPGSPGLLPEPDAVDSMRVCRYEVDPAAQRQVSDTIDSLDGSLDGALEGESDRGSIESAKALDTLVQTTGTFVSVQILPQKQAHAVLAAARSGAGAPECDVPASSFAVLWPLLEEQNAGAPISVELNGCERLIPADGKARVLPDGLLAAL